MFFLSVAAAGECLDSSDCASNAVCDNGSCVCDTGFTGLMICPVGQPCDLKGVNYCLSECFSTDVLYEKKVLGFEKVKCNT